MKNNLIKLLMKNILEQNLLGFSQIVSDRFLFSTSFAVENQLISHAVSNKSSLLCCCIELNFKRH